VYVQIRGYCIHAIFVKKNHVKGAFFARAPESDLKKADSVALRTKISRVRGRTEVVSNKSPPPAFAQLSNKRLSLSPIRITTKSKHQIVTVQAAGSV